MKKMIWAVAALVLTGMSACNSKQNVAEQDAAEVEVAVEDNIYDEPEVLPNFLGDLNQYIADSLSYPRDCAEEKLEAEVMVSFIVEKDGSITNVEATSEGDERFVKEAVEFVKGQQSLWEAGKNAEGEPVRTRMVLPVTFKL